MENFGKFMFALLVLVVGSVINSFVIYKLWLWILVPVFALTPLTMGASFGLSVIVSFLKQRVDNKEPGADETDKIVKLLITVIVTAGAYLLFGWIASMMI